MYVGTLACTSYSVVYEQQGSHIIYLLSSYFFSMVFLFLTIDIFFGQYDKLPTDPKFHGNWGYVFTTSNLLLSQLL